MFLKVSGSDDESFGFGILYETLLHCVYLSIII